MSERKDVYLHGTVSIPVPTIAPFGIALDDPRMVQDVWDTFVKPAQDSSEPQSVEMRSLMAILRAVNEGLAQRAAKGDSDE